MASSDNIPVQAVALIFIFPAIATVALALRVYIRLSTRTFASDDWVISGAGILYWAETVTSYYVIKYQHIGYHVWDIPKDIDTTPGAKYGYITEILYNPILALVKTSILLFLLRLTGQKIAVRRSIWALLVLNGVAMVATFLLTAFHCIPIAANWYPERYPDSHCINFADFVTGTACVSIFTDVLVLMLPTWIVYNLRISWNQKMMLIGILSVGLISVISGIVRVILLDNYDRHLPKDYTYTVLFCVSTIEVGLSFVAACAPSLKPLVVKIIPKVFGTKSRSGEPYGTSKRSRSRGHELDDRSRRTGVNTTSVEAGEREDGNVGGDKRGIFMTTEMEVRWEGGRAGSSTESLMQPVK